MIPVKQKEYGLTKEQFLNSSLFLKPETPKKLMDCEICGLNERNGKLIKVGRYYECSNCKNVFEK